VESGDIAGAQEASRVLDTLPGMSAADQPENYAGYITVDAASDSHMFFWFFKATVSTAFNVY
jgi:hypothetical protein